MRKTIYFQEERVINAPIGQIWSLLEDTNQLNQEIGLFPVRFSPYSHKEGSLFRQSRTRVFGAIEIAWREYAFEWIKQQSYSLERVYTKGPIVQVQWKVSVEPQGENTTLLKLKGDFTYRNLVGRLAMKIIIIPQLRKTFLYALQLEGNSGVAAIRPRLKQVAVVEKERLDRLTAKLTEAFSNEQMIEQLIQTLVNGKDEEVTSMKPLQWAEIHKFDRRQTVELFLIATKVGVLDQEWSLMCPNCRVPKSQTNTLRQLDNTVHCDLCGVDYEIDFDRYVEMLFSVNPSIRQTSQALFCVNGPLNSPHVVAQFRIPSHSSMELELPDWDQKLRWRVLKFNYTTSIYEGTDDAKSILTLKESGFAEKEVAKTRLMQVENQTSQEFVLVLEEVDWDRFALTAREVTSLQLFRELFATEVLSPDQQIGVGNMTILFTDLKGSTQLYESIGDALAYSNVKKHFDFLRKYIQANHGTIVKTIGDSVMAAFIQDKDAFNAALAIQKNIHLLNENISQAVQVKIGFYTGPVIAVNANEILDYFGRTVNMAARIQQQSVGGDIVISEHDYRDLLESDEFSVLDLTLEIESLTKKLHGVDGDTRLIRIRL
ncbi:adenylate/guanylate cyclase domain-containing protein [Sporosarcina sp. E16_8]|uniref:adenylate/guanylate cyclase domain-containing protein n=1 Tax=Sporosarcina sp. E16_8 TaxID=2789295 RepID=UPI001A93630D|nr:adenylate/guanylate cyclase domain-containing protein [Sporosarcina sp. E16_8]MBO0589303.1 adenylate/guanylate cyclase domain-containing protein [Sporosarcina sp. E16_8]